LGSAQSIPGERMIDLEDVKRGPNSEIAVLYDAKQLLSE